MTIVTLERLLTKKDALAVVGLGYVGLPIAVAFAEKVKTLGFDIDEEKIAKYRQGIDVTREVGEEKLRSAPLEFTSDPERLQEASFIIVAVPTPINGDKTPNLDPMIVACKLIGQNLSPGTIVVFESTVYPGVTEDVCVPMLESSSGLICGQDFKVGYSPERINPGDKIHRLENICKIVSAIDSETVDAIAAVYGLIIYGSIYRASSIKVAEAAKVAENAQRDVNIAFMNELAMAFDRMGISTKDVLDAMNTKWNALGFSPGLVGGHCIGVDPHYFIYQAQVMDYRSEIIAIGRQINDGMVDFITDKVIKQMIRAGKNVKTAAIYIMGITFKEDCPDMRNSKAVGICRRLADYGLTVTIVDPLIDEEAFSHECGLPLARIEEVREADCLIFLVAHQQFKELGAEELVAMCRQGEEQSSSVIIDIKNIFDRKEIERHGFSYWSL